MYFFKYLSTARQLAKQKWIIKVIVALWPTFTRSDPEFYCFFVRFRFTNVTKSTVPYLWYLVWEVRYSYEYSCS